MHKSESMGKKATFYLLNNLLIAATVGFLLLAAACWYAPRVDPCIRPGWVVVGLAMPVVMAFNLGLLVYWLIRRRWIAFVPLLALLLNMSYVASVFQLPNPWHPAERDYDFTVVTLNVHGFRQELGFRSSVEQTARFMREHKADVVCLQEFREGRSMPLDSIVAAFDFLPHHRLEGGLALFSRYPIGECTYFDYGDGVNGAMVADLDIDGRPVRLLNVHLQTSGMAPLMRIYRKEPGMGVPWRQARGTLLANACKRAEQARQLRRIIDATDGPTVVAGDLNDMPSSYTYRTLRDGLRDGFRQRGSGFGSTFRGMKGLLRLDYIFFGKGLICQVYEIPDVRLSDHRPVIAELEFN